MKVTLTIDPRDEVPYPNYWEGFIAALSAAFPAAEIIIDRMARPTNEKCSDTFLECEDGPLPGGRNAAAIEWFQAEIGEQFFL